MRIRKVKKLKRTASRGDTVHQEEDIPRFSFITGTAADMLHSVTGGHMLAHKLEAKHPRLEAVSVLLLLTVNKQKIMSFFV